MHANHSVEEFIVVGFTILTHYHQILFILLLILYLIIVTSNSITCYAIFHEPRLHTPMYFLIGVLSIIEISIVTAGYPTLFAVVLVGKAHISFTICLMQMYIIHSIIITENCLLNIMAYDRYLAINNPLRYHSIMTSRFCKILIHGCWLFGFLAPLALLILVSRAAFCGPNEIQHIVCDSSPLLTLSCEDNSLNVMADLVTSSFTLIFTFLSTVMTYTRILFTIFKMRTSQERKKAYSICATHLIMAIIFYGSVTFMYIKLQINYSTEYDLATAIHHFVLAPFFTPLIYSLCSKEVKNFLIKCFCSNKLSSADMQISRKTSSHQ
ncbi:olfactory receptor 6N1-like [Pelobates fuscus]|uniref:olfactory receptor 6N1-like n=1 Tax=Pelobates fuscus TaxID=191477 RepID=UPI002FE4F240